jgi:flavin reductase (DIM6/NTAB) family NADH-FMN oxidoreductase RutF
MESHTFTRKARQQFRRYFQPSRILLAVLPSEGDADPNLITLCFNMHCSYKPPIMAFSIFKGALSFQLACSAKHCVLTVPGEDLARAVLLCGTVSGRDINKFRETGLTPCRSETVPVPGISEAIANVELKIVHRVELGDHITVFGEVLKFGVDEKNRQRPLVSFGPETKGYTLLAQKGIHRIGIVETARQR